ncbi:MAG: YihY/virulence factor BrkB family protein [Crocinitomicaceae bacterium]|nr:YihY/virulence factor BrkB family protein [Crocinitomicaceae bacterium]
MPIKSKVIKFFKDFWFILKDSATNFMANGDIKFSAALSYYTIFSLAPMLLLALMVGGFVFGQDAVQGHLFEQMNGLVGDDVSAQIENMLAKISLNKNTFVATVIGIITLIVGATSMFGEIQSTINRIWGIKTKPSKGIITLLFNRLLSFTMVLIIGFLLMVSLAASAIIDLLNTKIIHLLPDFSYFIMNVVSNIVSLFIVSVLFMLIFKFLPDAMIRLKDAFVGAIFTSALFLLGKYLIGIYLTSMANADIFGAAGSIIILLLWVYYSSILLYFGAEFTKSYALNQGQGIQANKYSILVQYKEIEIDRPIDNQELKKINEEKTKSISEDDMKLS